MLTSGSATGGRSQDAVDSRKPADSRRWCSWSRRRSLFVVLVVVAVLFIYSTNIKEMTPGWNPNWWMQFDGKLGISSSRQIVISSNTSASRVETSSSVFHETETTTSTKDSANAQNQATNATVVTQQEPGPSAPVPYKSPGPYLVEYPNEYDFIINMPETCEQQKPFLVLMVPVAPKNRAHRDVVRRTWGNESLVQDKVVKLFFILGLQTGEGAEQLQEQLLQESVEHQDLIQSNFLDCYKNLTIKTMVMLEWLDAYCSNASYAMKIDSDMFLNLPNLVGMLTDAPRTNYMTGLVERGAVVLRSPGSKWYVPEELYPHPHYPRYALGLGYILSLDLPRKLVEASRHVKALYLEDVYLGLCLQHLGISPTDPPGGGYFHVFPVTYSRCAYSRLIATTTHEDTDRMKEWEDFKKPGPYC